MPDQRFFVVTVVAVVVVVMIRQYVTRWDSQGAVALARFFYFSSFFFGFMKAWGKLGTRRHYLRSNDSITQEFNFSYDASGTPR